MNKKKTTKLNKQQKLFCKYKAEGYSNEESAVKAGYAKTYAKTHSHKLLEKPEIKKEVERLEKIKRKVADEKFEITQEKVIQELAKIAFFDPRKLFDEDGKIKPVTELDGNTAAVIAGLDVSKTITKTDNKTTEEEFIKRIKLCDKNSGLEKLCKYLGLYEKDNKQKEINIVSMGAVKIGGKPLELNIGEELDADS